MAVKHYYRLLGLGSEACCVKSTQSDVLVSLFISSLQVTASNELMLMIRIILFLSYSVPWYSVNKLQMSQNLTVLMRGISINKIVCLSAFPICTSLLVRESGVQNSKEKTKHIS